jgi:hypothetical protein
VAIDGDNPNGNMTVDFGIFRPAALGSIVWYDTDGNGHRDPAEAGVAGVVVTLYHGDGTPVLDPAGNPIQVTTGPDGTFLFTNLIPGDYQLGFSNLPVGLTFTDQNLGSDDSDSDVNRMTQRTDNVTLAAGQSDLTVYAGLIDPMAIALVSFNAERSAEGVVLRWVTAMELNTWGFQIYRSADGTRASAVRITDRVILARGSAQSGATYTWTDTSAEPGVTYSYWLEEVEIDGGTNEYGPAQPAIEPAAGEHRLYLALFMR